MTAALYSPHIGLVVEGPGDRESIPVLLRKHMHAKADYRDVIAKVLCSDGKSNLTREEGIEGYVAAASARPGCVGILVVLDGDDDCPANLGPELLSRCKAVTNKPVEIVVIERTFEDWLYASIETLDYLKIEPYQLGIRGIKYIQNNFHGSYVKPVFQPKLTHRMDLAIARSRIVSLDRALNKFDFLLTRL